MSLPSACCLHAPCAPQLAVEEYFSSSGALPVATYWIGISRPSKSSPFRFADNVTVSNVPSDEPYIHWNWLFPNRRILDYHCALARRAAGWCRAGTLC